MTTVEATFRFRRDTAANWTSVNPVLQLGEPGLETDTRKLKYGDGVSTWTALKYATYWGGVSGTLTDQVDLKDALDKKQLKESFGTISTDTNFTLTFGSSATTTRHTGTLSADRVCTLTPNAPNGSTFRLVRRGGGSFNIDFGSLKNLAQNTWAVAMSDGSNWFLVEYGTL